MEGGDYDDLAILYLARALRGELVTPSKAGSAVMIFSDDRTFMKRLADAPVANMERWVEAGERDEITPEMVMSDLGTYVRWVSAYKEFKEGSRNIRDISREVSYEGEVLGYFCPHGWFEGNLSDQMEGIEVFPGHVECVGTTRNPEDSKAGLSALAKDYLFQLYHTRRDEDTDEGSHVLFSPEETFGVLEHLCRRAGREENFSETVSTAERIFEGCGAREEIYELLGLSLRAELENERIREYADNIVSLN